jgi:hypothetical protein
LLLVDRGEPDDRPRLVAERERLITERDRLIDAIAAGVPASSVAATIRERERQIAILNAQLRAPRQDAPDLEQVRAALTKQTATWRRPTPRARIGAAGRPAADSTDGRARHVGPVAGVGRMANVSDNRRAGRPIQHGGVPNGIRTASRPESASN